MGAKVLDGLELARKLRQEAKELVDHHLGKGHRAPKLSVILIGEDPASRVYVKQKEKACHEVGIYSKICQLPVSVSQTELEKIILDLNKDIEVDGILLQLPIPLHLNRSQCLDMIHPDKDVDGLTSFNQGTVLTGLTGLHPCTPLGIMALLKSHMTLRGKKIALIGYSLLVGAPLSAMLVQSGATVTVITKATVDAPRVTRECDVTIVAAGVKHLVDKSWVREQSVLIDVGIHRDDSGISGDINFDDVKSVVSAVTPVPGGVGPMTVAFLLKNCLAAYLKNIPQ